MRQPYQVLDEFFDAYSLAHALDLLADLIRTASSHKIWKGKCPANAIYFSERLQLLTKAVFSLQNQYEYHEEVKLKKEEEEEIWMNNRYETSCGALPEILDYIKEAASSQPLPVPGSMNFKRTWIADKNIGFDQQGRSANAITVITDPVGTIITAYAVCELYPQTKITAGINGSEDIPG